MRCSQRDLHHPPIPCCMPWPAWASRRGIALTYLESQVQLRRFGDIWVRWTGDTTANMAEAVLHVLGAPATAEAIFATIGAEGGMSLVTVNGGAVGGLSVHSCQPSHVGSAGVGSH